MMNKLFMIVLSVCCLLMAACGTDNDETPQGFRIVDTDVDLVAGSGFTGCRRTDGCFRCGLVQGDRSDKRENHITRQG